jgi:signal transduction histidine kinase
MIEQDESRSILKIALNSTERIQRLVNSLLDINRLQAGQTIATLQTVTPQMLIQSAIQDVMPAATGRHQTIEARISEKTPNVWVDAEMIRRVLINLLENAIKFSKAEAKIMIGAKQDGEFVQFWVQDNGPGIPPSEHKRIFEKFARIKGKERTSGLGIGLAFCRMAVSAHGGMIWVESEEGKGAKFLFNLPAVESKD